MEKLQFQVLFIFDTGAVMSINCAKQRKKTEDPNQTIIASGHEE